MMIPFLAPSIMIVLAGYRARYAPWIGWFAAAATAAVGAR